MTTRRDLVHWHHEIVPLADPGSFTELSPHFAKDDARVWGWCVNTRKIYPVDANPADFRVLNATYGRDREDIFFADCTYRRFDEDTHQASFEVLSDGFARDRSRVYSGYDDLNGVAPARVARTKSFLLQAGDRIFWRSLPLERFNKNIQWGDISFSDNAYLVTTSGVFFANDDKTANPVLVKEANPQSFRLVGTHFYRDAAHVFADGEALPDADPETFRILGRMFAKDLRHAYFLQHPVKGADAGGFRLFAEPQLSPGFPLLTTGTQEDREYRLREIEEDFRIYFARDEHRVYVGADAISGIDPDTFQVLFWDHESTSCVADKSGTYLLPPDWRARGLAPRKVTPSRMPDGKEKNAFHAGLWMPAKDLVGDEHHVYFRGRTIAGVDPKSVEAYPGSFFYFRDRSHVYWCAPGHSDRPVLLKSVKTAEFIAPMVEKDLGTDKDYLYRCGSIDHVCQERWALAIPKWRSGAMTNQQFDQEAGDSGALRAFLAEHRDKQGYWWSEQYAGQDRAGAEEGYRHLGDSYYTDGRLVYYAFGDALREAKPLKNSDPASFTLVSRRYAKDRNHVYLDGRIIGEADPGTFEYLLTSSEHSEWARDRNFLFRSNGHKTFKQVKGADFTLLDTAYGTDGKVVVCLRSERVMPSAHAKSFEVVKDTGLALDRKSFYQDGSKVSKTDFDVLFKEAMARK